MNKIKIIATDESGDRFEIKNLCWFEWTGVTTLEDGKDDSGEQYLFEILINDVLVWSNIEHIKQKK